MATAKPTVGFNVTSILDGANAAAARGLAPVSGVVDLLPLTPSMKQIMKNKPIDALLLMGEPLEGFLRDVVTHANELSGVYSRTMINGVAWNMNIDQPGDDRMSPTLRAFMRRLRTINSYVVLLIHDPGHLGVAAAQVGAARGLQGAQWLGRFVSTVGAAAHSGPQAAVAAAGGLMLTLVPGVAGLGAAVAPLIAAGGSMGAAAITAAGALTGTVVTAQVASANMQVKAKTDVEIAKIAAGTAAAHDEASSVGGIPGWLVGLGLLGAGWALTRK